MASRHSWQCVCKGDGTIEEGPAGATYSVPCPGPPERIARFGVEYERVKPKPPPCIRCGNHLGGGSGHGPGFCPDLRPHGATGS
jgi:hypothetical protein